MVLQGISTLGVYTYICGYLHVFVCERDSDGESLDVPPPPERDSDREYLDVLQPPERDSDQESLDAYSCLEEGEGVLSHKPPLITISVDGIEEKKVL